MVFYGFSSYVAMLWDLWVDHVAKVSSLFYMMPKMFCIWPDFTSWPSSCQPCFCCICNVYLVVPSTSLLQSFYFKFDCVGVGILFLPLMNWPAICWQKNAFCYCYERYNWICFRYCFHVIKVLVCYDFYASIACKHVLNNYVMNFSQNIHAFSCT